MAVSLPGRRDWAWPGRPWAAARRPVARSAGLAQRRPRWDTRTLRSNRCPVEMGECANSLRGNVGMAAQRHKSCRPRSTSRLGRATLFLRVFLRAASESAPTGRWAALLRSEAGPGHARSLRVTRPRERADLRKRREGGAHRYAVACVPITVGITVPITVGVEVVVWGTDPGTSQGTK